MRKILILILFISPLIGFTQVGFKTWVNFNTRIRFYDDSVSCRYFGYGYSSLLQYAAYGTVDDSDGNILFTSDGVIIDDKNMKYTPQTGAMGKYYGFNLVNQSTIVPWPKKDSAYMWFKLTDEWGSYYRSLRYFDLDQKLNNGLGDITDQIGKIIHYDASYGFIHTRNRRNTGYWLIMRLGFQQAFEVYKIDTAGLDRYNSITSKVSQIYCPSGRNYVKIAHDNKTLAVGYGSENKVELFEFDDSTGKIKSLNVFDVGFGVTSLEFSPDCNKLYVGGQNAFAQFDITDKTDSSKIVNSKYYYFLNYGPVNLLIGPDCRIYVSYSQYSLSFGVINFPNQKFPKCGYEIKGLFIDYNISSNKPVVSNQTGDLPNLPSFAYNFEPKRNKASIVGNNICTGDSVLVSVDLCSPGKVTTKFNYADMQVDTGVYMKHLKYWKRFDKAGTYPVKIYIETACGEDSFQQNVFVYNRPKDFLGPDTSLCPNTVIGPTNLTGYSYAWSSGDSTSTIAVNQTGKYILHVNKGAYCDATDTVNINILPAPIISMQSDYILCVGDNLTLDGGSGATSYLWSNGKTTQTIETTKPGKYSVTATDANGCASNKQAKVTLASKPSVILSLNNDSLYTNNNNTIKHDWSLDGSFLITTAKPWLHLWIKGTYIVTVYDSNGCKNTSSPFKVDTVFNSLEEASKNSHYNIYPNPTNDLLYIEGLPAFKINIVLFDMLGKKVYNTITNGGILYCLSIDHLPKGIYILDINGERLKISKE